MVDKDAVETGSETLKFVAQMVSALAWPATTIVCILLLKKYLSSLIPMLRTVKYSDVEIKFGKEVSELAMSANVSSLPSNLSESKISPWEDLISLAKVRPRTAIRSAWQRVEQAALQLTKDRNIEVSEASMSMPMVVGAILLNQGAISTSQYDLLSRLRALRNEAEHAPPDTIDSENAAEFIGLALRLAASLNSTDL